MSGRQVPRVAFDTNAVVSALIFSAGKLLRLRAHWRQHECTPLVSRATARELIRVLAYPKFQLSAGQCLELQSDYLPYCEIVDPRETCPACCRDPKNQPFLDLAYCGEAEILVSGDKDLLALAKQVAFTIETPEAYCRRISGESGRPKY